MIMMMLMNPESLNQVLMQLMRLDSEWALEVNPVTMSFSI